MKINKIIKEIKNYRFKDEFGHPLENCMPFTELKQIGSEEEYRKEIYKKAIEKWGAGAQICMTFEEMAELQKELCKDIRGRGYEENIAEEIADVEIMLEQMKLLFEVENQVDKFKKYKLERLEERLKNMEERK